MRSSAGGISARVRLNSGGSSLRIAVIVSAAVSRCERAPARQHFVQHGAEREQVAPPIHNLPADLLGRHVADRTHDCAGIGDARRAQGRLACRAAGTQVRGRHRAREAKVENLHLTVVQDENVLGLQVAMDDPLVVCRRKAAGHLNGTFRRLADRERAARQAFTQRLAIEQFHGRIDQPVVSAEIEDRQDVRMRKRGDRFRFALEPRQPVGVLRKRRRKYLDGYVTIEAGVPGFIDFAHSAGPEGGLDLVRAESRAGGEGQTRGLYRRDHSVNPPGCDRT